MQATEEQIEVEDVEITLSEPQELILTSTQDINLFLAGIGSGKTHLGGILSGYFIDNFPNAWGFIGANTYQQLTTSTLYRIREVWKIIFNWVEGVDYVVGKIPPKHFNTEGHNFDSYNSIISFKNGTVVFKGSLDNAKAHDGKEFSWSILDETKDTKEQDVKDTILTRLRKPAMYVDEDGQLTSEQYNGETKRRGFNPMYILTSPAKVAWLNEWFELDEKQDEILVTIFDEKDYWVREFNDKCVVISSTYHNEQNLPAGFIDKVIQNNTKEAAEKLIFGNPFVRTGGEFYSGFDRMVHIDKCPYIPELPIHISFDQNVKPYITMTLHQVRYLDDGTIEFRTFDEICLKNPRNKTSKLCLEFIRRYGNTCTGLYFYGDRNGRNTNTRTDENDYDIVERMLRRFINNKSNRVAYRNPSVLKRKNFINDSFEGLRGIKILFDPKCKETIKDFTFVKEDINGKKLKEKVKDENGAKIEKYGHTSDAFDYCFIGVFEKKYELHYT